MIRSLSIASATVISAVLATMAPAARAADHRVLYAFGGGKDGAYPLSALTRVGAKLYGTTSGGGVLGLGTVFVLAGGGETVLHAFAGGTDGATPVSGLAAMDGSLFGTTYLGGGSTGCPDGCGTVFSVNAASGAEASVYAFRGFLSGDGAYPLGTLLPSNGVLYGTTVSGGAMFGTTFSLVPGAGADVVLQGADANPEAGVIEVGGTLYGTETNGGETSACVNTGCGLVFGFNLASGQRTDVHLFAGSPDGSNPESSLVYVGGRLFGTTFVGGAFDKGTVFAVDPVTGAEQVVHSFKDGSDGAFPVANLTAVGGVLYGTTSQGGRSASCTLAGGCGAVFAIDPASGGERVVYAFGGGGDGQTPDGGLIEVNGTLYGTTAYGGHAAKCTNGGCGTVFSLVP